MPVSVNIVLYLGMTQQNANRKSHDYDITNADNDQVME